MSASEPLALFEVGHIARLPLGTPYPSIVSHVGRLLAALPGDTELVIDQTGVGGPVGDMFVYSGISPIRVMITAGTAETRDGMTCSVPKLILISRVQALLHQGQLRIKRSLPEAEVLVRELQDFRVEYTAGGNITFNARQGRHDDLVLALAIACWRAHGGGSRFEGLLTYYRSLATGSPFAAPRYYVGVDLGQSRDPTAIAIVKRIDGPSRADLHDPAFVRETAVAG
jgi:hypothetical protein